MKTSVYKHGRYWDEIQTETLPRMVFDWRNMAVGLMKTSGADHAVYCGIKMEKGGAIKEAHFMMKLLDGDEFDKFLDRNSHFTDIGAIHAADKPLQYPAEIVAVFAEN